MREENRFHHMLVPLDGSGRAESVVPVAACIARATGGSLLFVRVVMPPGDSPAYVIKPFIPPQEALATSYQAASAYLEAIAQLTALNGISVQTRVLVGMPAQHILSCIGTFSLPA